MTFDDLVSEITQHKGEFLCEDSKKNTKRIRFHHVVTPPSTSLDNVPAVGELRELYSHVGSILFYFDPLSGDAGKYLAPLESWAEFHDSVSNWLNGINEEDADEFVPKWLDTALVIGETPHSGNYILIPTVGDEAGCVFEFDHDGLEFTYRSINILEYIVSLVFPDGSVLDDMASHMRFAVNDPMHQWVIRELVDNRGDIVQR